MLPIAKFAVTGLASMGAGTVINHVFSNVVKNSTGIAKVLVWFGVTGLSITVGSVVQREVGKQFDETVDAVKEIRTHIEIED